MQSVAYLVQQETRRTPLRARRAAVWGLAMACSLRGPSSQILWQRWLCTCCTRPSLPYSTAASWLIVALLALGLITKYRSKITKQPRRVNTTLLSPDSPLPLPSVLRRDGVLYCERAFPCHDREASIAYIAQIPFAQVAASRRRTTHYDISFNIPFNCPARFSFFFFRENGGFICA